MNLLVNKGLVIGLSIGAVVVVLLIAIIAWYISTHNKFVALGANWEDALSTIDVYLKKRYDLIPNLVETVKGYAAHEQDTFRMVTEARSKAMNATTVEEKAEADKAMGVAMRNFYAVMEKYPELKANTNFLDLQNQLKQIENELAQTRKYYNAVGREFNIKRESFPSSIVAKRMKLTKKPYFEAVAEERENVRVKF